MVFQTVSQSPLIAAVTVEMTVCTTAIATWTGVEIAPITPVRNAEITGQTAFQTAEVMPIAT